MTSATCVLRSVRFTVYYYYHYYYISAAGVALDFLVSYFLWQIKYLSCDELAEKTDMHLETFQALFHSTEI